MLIIYSGQSMSSALIGCLFILKILKLGINPQYLKVNKMVNYK